MMLANLFCTGSEDSLLDCRRNDYGIQYCAAYEVAGVQCEGTEFACSSRSGMITIYSTYTRIVQVKWHA